MIKNKKIQILIVATVLVIIAVVIAVVIMNQGHRVIKVESVEGTVVLEREASEKEIFEDMNLKSEDTITTGADGLIGLLADGDKHIAAIENTCFSIVSEGNKKEGRLKIELKYGTSLIEIENKLPDGATFEVETPNAALSVRGTTFEVSYIPETNTTILKVTDGAVQVDTNVEIGMVNAGGMATITDSHIEMQAVSIGNGEPTQGTEDANTGAGENEETLLAGTYIKEDEWPDLLKGGSNLRQLEYLLGIAKQCKDNGNTDYLKTALKGMCYTSSITDVYEPIAQAEDGSLIYTYDISKLNEMYSFLTDEKISEEHLYLESSINGNELTCVYPDYISLDEAVSMTCGSAYYGENEEIIVEGNYMCINISTGVVENESMKAHLILDADGKYVLNYIE